MEDEFCRQRHQLPGLNFVHGDAENLPFGGESFDAVINVDVDRHDDGTTLTRV